MPITLDQEKLLRSAVVSSFNSSINVIDLLSLLQIPEFRGIVNSSVLDLTAIQNNSGESNSSELDDKYLSRPGTIDHNFKSFQGLKNFDRGAQLTQLTWGFVPPSLRKHCKVLHIGPRNTNELLLSIALTGVPQNIFAVDIDPQSLFITSGDMHQLEFEDNTFDVVILGWVLGYSKDPIKAIKEIVRVSKKDSLIGIGWDMDEPPILSQGDAILKPRDDAFLYRSGESLISLFELANLNVSKLHVTIDPQSPFCNETKQGMIVLSPNKRKTKTFAFNALSEAEAVSRVLRLYDNIKDKDETISETSIRLLNHKSQALLGFCEESYDLGSYLTMRKHSVKGTSTDNLLSQSLSISFPWKKPNFESSGFPSLFNQSNFSVNKAIIDLNTQGYYLFPDIFPNDLIDDIDNILKKNIPLDLSGRTMIDELILLKSPLILGVCFSSELISLAGAWLNSMPVFNTVAGMVTNPIFSENLENTAAKMNEDAQIFHHDKDRIRWLNFFLYLTDVTCEADGAHVLVSSTNSQGPLRDGRVEESEVNLHYGENALLNKKVVLGKRGTLFAVDTSNLHRGSRLINGQRRVLEVTYANSLFGAATCKREEELILPMYHRAIEDHPRIFTRFV